MSKHKPQNVNLLHQAEIAAGSFNTKLAAVITRSFGSMFTFYALVLWMFIWMILASMGFWLFSNDKYPFTFLLFLSNLIQLWALPVLAVGQNVLSRHQEIQADETYSTSEKTFADTETIMRQNEELMKQTAMLVQLLQSGK